MGTGKPRGAIGAGQRDEALRAVVRLLARQAASEYVRDLRTAEAGPSDPVSSTTSSVPSPPSSSRVVASSRLRALGPCR